MENKKENDSSQRASSSTKKFNSELFNKPFIENDLNNNNNPSLNSSILSHQSNNDISSNNISFNKSVNSSLNDTNKKRKPFDNIHFQGNNLEDVGNLSASNSVRSSAKLLNISESIPKSNADTEITANKKCLKVNETHEMISRNNQGNEIENMNNTKMSDMDKSSLIRTQSALDKETVSKALKYNKASDKENCPFWVKFFLEENVNLNENSSYFKAKDKEQYIKTMIEITKNDAKLEEKNKILKENRDKTFNELKKLLLTELREENIKEEEKEKCKNLEDDSENKDKKVQKNQMKKKENIANLVSKYSDSNKRENYLEKNLDMNYYEFMKKQKELDDKKENHIQKNIKNVGGSPLMNKYNHKKQISLNHDEVYKNEDPYPSLEQLDFEKENFEKVAFRYYGKDVLKSLFDIDAKLEKLNPAYKNFSTKSDLKNLKENYKKSSYNKPVKKQTNDKYSKVKVKKDEEFQNLNADVRFRRELKTTLNEIDTQILLTQRKEINREKIETFIENMNKSKYANAEEREKALDFKIPEEAVFDRMEKQFGDCDRMLKELKVQILEKEKRDKEKSTDIKEHIKEEPSAEELENQKNLDNILEYLEFEETKTKGYINGLDTLQEKIVEENNVIDKELDNVQDLIMKNEKEYDNILKKYEEEIELKYSNEDDDKDRNEGEKSIDHYYKLYGVEDIIHHDYNNDLRNTRTNFKKEMEKIQENIEIVEDFFKEK